MTTNNISRLWSEIAPFAGVAFVLTGVFLSTASNNETTNNSVVLPKNDSSQAPTTIPFVDGNPIKVPSFLRVGNN